MKKQMSTHARCAKEIRKILKSKFPETKFSVTSESYSMGSSVRISWTDGVTTDQVDELVGQFEYGHFNGMEDIYEYSNTREDIPQVKFVTTNREMSDEVREQIIKAHNDSWCEKGQIKDIEAYNEDWQCWNHTVVYRHFVKLDLTKGFAGLESSAI